MADRLRKVQELFEQAADLDPAERREFLYKASGGDDTLVTEVEALLRHDHEANDSLYISVQDQAAGAFRDKPRRETIGKYRVLRELGQGGMGTVYLATRDDDQYEKQVAIKLVPAVVDRDELMRRFRAERQIMASLEHPNIAHLLDGDTTRDGIPYVVMEYVQGQPIDVYCEETGLGVEDKLRLFLKVCDAISHAHRNLVIHRDIKPGNILVTEDGEPKLLDFGIAKILDTKDAVALTRSGMRLMTPEYASPEQARGEVVNTATDVYSLGVLLQKLLTGELPYELDSRNVGAIEKIICDQAPVRPSQQRPDVGSELDDIVAMALRKEPARRYGTVSAFADDLQRYLDDRPVLARPDSVRYRVSKYIQRHRIGVVASVAAVVVVSAIVTFYTARLAGERDIATAQAEKARRVVELLGNVMQASGPEIALGESITAKDLLRHGAERARSELADEPELLAELLAVVSRTYQSLDMFEESWLLASEALELRQQALEPDDERIAESLFDTGYASIYRGELGAARDAFEQALRIYEKNFGDTPHVGTAATLRELSYLYYREGLREAGKAAIDRAMTMMMALFPDGSEELAATLNILAFSEMRSGQWREAIETSHKIIEMRRELYGDIHPKLASALQNTAFIYYELHDLENAETYLQHAVDMRRTLYGEDATQMESSIGLLSGIRYERGDVVGGLAAADRLLDIRRRRYPDPRTALIQGAVAADLRLHALDDRFEDVIRLASRRKEILEAAPGADATKLGSLSKMIAEAFIGLGQIDSAERELHYFVERGLDVYSSDELWLRTMQADIQGLKGNYDAAIATYLDIEKNIHPDLADNSGERARDLLKLGLLFEKAGDRERSRNYLGRALAIYEVTQVPESPRLRTVREALARLNAPQDAGVSSR